VFEYDYKGKHYVSRRRQNSTTFDVYNNTENDDVLNEQQNIGKPKTGIVKVDSTMPSELYEQDKFLNRFLLITLAGGTIVVGIVSGLYFDRCRRMKKKQKQIQT
jgi:hypothetical protein